MIKMFSTFLIVFGLIFFGLIAFKQMTGKEKWQLTKLVIYSIICAVLTTAALVGFVLIF
jgi:hypothetical protein